MMLGGSSVSLIVVLYVLSSTLRHTVNNIRSQFQVGRMGVTSNALRKSTSTGPQSHYDLSRVSWCWYLLLYICVCVFVWCVPFSDCFSFLMLFGLPVDFESLDSARFFVCVIPLLA